MFTGIGVYLQDWCVLFTGLENICTARECEGQRRSCTTGQRPTHRSLLPSDCLYLSVSLSLSASVCLSLSLSASLYLCLSLSLSASLCVPLCLSLPRCVCLSAQIPHPVCLSASACIRCQPLCLCHIISALMAFQQVRDIFCMSAPCSLHSAVHVNECVLQRASSDVLRKSKPVLAPRNSKRVNS